MRSIRNLVVLSAICAAGVYVGYMLLLTDEAKAKLKEAAGQVFSDIERIREIISPPVEETDEAAEGRKNAEKTKKQWEDLGF